MRPDMRVVVAMEEYKMTSLGVFVIVLLIAAILGAKAVRDVPDPHLTRPAIAEGTIARPKG